MNRKYLPTFAELIDRLSIDQLKEVLLTEHKEKYSKYMEDIISDIDSIIKEKDIILSGNLIASIIALAQINTHMWYNESKARKGENQDADLLKLTHGLNGIRGRLQNYIACLIGIDERLDWKTDCLAAEFKDWKISLLDKNI